MISLLLMKQIGQLFLCMFMGFAIVKSKVLKSEESKPMSAVALYLVVPCMIITSFQIDYTESIRDGLLLAFAAAVLIHALLLLLVPLIGRLLHLDAVEQASIIYSNAGNLIIPLVTSVLGPEWVIYTSAFLSVQLVLLWTHGRMMLCGQKHFDIKKIVTNVNLISVLIGAFLFFSGLRLPEVLEGTMKSVGSMVGPLCMIVTGMLLGDVSLKQIFAYRRIYLVTALKMLIGPAIVLGAIKLSHLSSLHPDGETILLISFLAVITPCASTITQMAQIYDRDAKYAGVIGVVTTVICIVTMPFMVMLYQI